MHTVSFSLGFDIVLRPQGIRKQMKTLRKRHRVHIAIVAAPSRQGHRNIPEQRKASVASISIT